jgi:regulator of protease activity HflC (stomatin/prohibitin superfamily)
MKVTRIVAIAVIGVIIGGGILLKVLTIYVPVGHAGVRTQEYALIGSKGVVQRDFGPGWHRDLGPVDSWVMFDSTVQILEMTRDPSRGTRKGRDDVQVQSADGYTVSVDVTVKYRIQPGKAHKVYQDTGSKDKYKVIVRNEAEKACMALFGQMKTEDFYNPTERRKRAGEVKGQLARSLSDNYVEVIDVLMRDVQFDPGYENKIRRKKLADQEVELNKSAARAEEMRGRTQLIEAETQRKLAVISQEKESELVKMRAETDREVAKITADAQKYVTEKRADADLVKAEKEAEGGLLVKKAEAEGERLRNRAMMGVGGSTIVALEAARNLKLSDVAISTLDTDLLDIDRMATKLGVPERTK